MHCQSCLLKHNISWGRMLQGCMHVLQQTRLHELLVCLCLRRGRMRPNLELLPLHLQLIGQPLPDDSVTQTAVVKKNGRTYYQWCVPAFLGSSSRLAAGSSLCCADVSDETPEKCPALHLCAPGWHMQVLS